ncbi:MAG: hypothetical protein AAED33_10275 [Paracoccaceae bacterium]
MSAMRKSTQSFAAAVKTRFPPFLQGFENLIYSSRIRSESSLPAAIAMLESPYPFLSVVGVFGTD